MSVCAANFAGAVGLALSGHTDMGGGAIGRTTVRIALAKQELPWQEALLRGVLCNVLVCMAVWMAMAGRSVVDKAVGANLVLVTAGNLVGGSVLVGLTYNLIYGRRRTTPKADGQATNGDQYDADQTGASRGD